MQERYNDEGREIRPKQTKKYTLDYYQREYRWQTNRR